MKLGRDLCVAVMVLGLVLAACKKNKSESKSDDTASGDKSGASDKPAEGTAAGGDSVGVPICDEFLTKWEKCIGKYPAVAQESTRQALKQARDGWKQTAATPQGKAALESACKQMMESQKAASASFGCEW
jgi:hypothetical protein